MKFVNDLQRQYLSLTIDERANVMTHGIGLLLAIVFAPVLLLSQAISLPFFGLCVFIASLCFMFVSSTTYHLMTDIDLKRKWQMVDHISIFLLIGGTYTPFILFYSFNSYGLKFLAIHWTIIACGIVFKLIFKDKYELFSLILYVVLGWMVLFIFKDITANMRGIVIFFLMAAGIFYSIGVYFFVKTNLSWHHAIWHIFVILGASGHYIALLLS